MPHGQKWKREHEHGSHVPGAEMVAGWGGVLKTLVAGRDGASHACDSTYFRLD